MRRARWSKGNGSPSRRPPGWWRALCFCTCFCTGLLLSGPGSYASEQSALIESLRLHLQTAQAQLTDLENKLASWKLLSAESEQQARQLSAELAQQRQELETLRGELEALQMFSTDSQKRVAALRISLSESEEKLKVLSKTCLDSANSWRRVAEEERRVTRKWKFAAVLVGAGALLAGGVAGYLWGSSR